MELCGDTAVNHLPYYTGTTEDKKLAILQIAAKRIDDEMKTIAGATFAIRCTGR
jgi:hypothetical protein